MSGAAWPPERRPPIALTPKQAWALRIIQEFIDDTGCAPTVRELANELDLAGWSSAQLTISSLIKRGWLERTPAASRALRVLHRLPPLPETFDVVLTDTGRVAAGRSWADVVAGNAPLG